MNNDNYIIPQYRFPEFKNDGSWDITKLGEIGELIGGGTPETSKEEYWNGNINWFTPSEIKSKYVKYSNRKITEIGLKNSSAKLLPIGSLLITTRATIGEISINEDPCSTNQGFQNLVVNHDNNNIFWYYSIQTIRNILISKSSGSTFPEISKNILANIDVLRPSNPVEQKKIAACLSSLDDVIAGHEEKLTALEEHKKGLMQNLFPQEGEAQPKYRFPEFENDEDWVARTIIDTADKNIKWSFTGGPFGSNLKSSDYTSKGIRIIQLQNIGDGVFNDEYKIYTSLDKADELLSCNIYSGDIILSKMGDPVGRACIMPGDNERYVMASDGIRLAVNEKEFSKYFIFSLINSDIIRTKIEANSTGSTRKRIGLDILKQIPLLIPKTLDEQQKIAEVLSSVDKVIVSQREKIAALKEHKQGLMQGLFPKIDS